MSDDREPLLELLPDMVASAPIERFVESKLDARMARKKGAVILKILDEKEFELFPYAPTPSIVLPGTIPETIEEPPQQQNGSAIYTEEKFQSLKSEESNESAFKQRSI